MKFSIFALALLPLALTACQSSHSCHFRRSGYFYSIHHIKNAYTNFARLYLELDRGLQRPIVLSFDQQGRLSVASGCNGLGTSWTVKDNTLSTGDMMGTMMA